MKQRTPPFLRQRTHGNWGDVYNLNDDWLAWLFRQEVILQGFQASRVLAGHAASYSLPALLPTSEVELSEYSMTARNASTVRGTYSRSVIEL